MALQGILFDKDGTLYDFHGTWSAWAAGFLTELAEGDPGRRAVLAQALDFDLAAERFRPESAVIAGTVTEVAGALHPHMPGLSVPELIARLDASAAVAPLAEAAPLTALLARLLDAGYVLGVATNDNEAPARAHLSATGILDLFTLVVGADSGFGAKPDPSMCLAFADATGLAPEAVVMVGDSTHDLHAGRQAGMRTVGVLTGTAPAAALAPLADIVLASIAELPAWLNTETR